MENFLSLTILVFLLVYLSYELFFSKKRKQKSNKEEQPDNPLPSASENSDSTTSKMNGDKSMDSSTIDSQSPSDQTKLKKDDDNEPTDSIHAKINEEHTLDPKILNSELDKIDKIVAKGLYGQFDKEQCLKEIKKIISNLKSDIDHD